MLEDSSLTAGPSNGEDAWKGKLELALVDAEGKPSNKGKAKILLDYTVSDVVVVVTTTATTTTIAKITTTTLEAVDSTPEKDQVEEGN